MALPDVYAGGPHAEAHNDERELINALQAVTDVTFKAKLALLFIAKAEVGQTKTDLEQMLNDAQTVVNTLDEAIAQVQAIVDGASDTVVAAANDILAETLVLRDSTQAIVDNVASNLAAYVSDILAQTEAARDEAVAIAGPVDGVVANLLKNEGGVGPLTNAEVLAQSAQDRDRFNHTGSQPATTISDLTETVQDVLGSSIVAGANLTMTYDDTTGVVTLSALAQGTPTDPEIVRDVIGNALASSGLINIAVNDAGDTITFTTTATANDTDVNLKSRANHTGSQPISSVTGLQAALDAALQRSNHTGSQPISSITGLQSALDAAGGLSTAKYKGLWRADSAYAAGDMVEFRNKVYKANTALVANSHSAAATYVNTWSADAGTNSVSSSSVTVPANGVAVGDLLILFSTVIDGDSLSQSGWTLISTEQYVTGNSKKGVWYRYATAADVSGGFTATVSGGGNLVGRASMIRAYRNVTNFNPVEFRGINALSASATTNPNGQAIPRRMLTFTTVTHSSATVLSTTGQGVDAAVSSESSLTGLSIIAADLVSSSTGTDWLAYSGPGASSGNMGQAYMFFLNIYDGLDLTKWTLDETVSQMFTELSAPNVLAETVLSPTTAVGTAPGTTSTDAANGAEVSFVMPADGVVYVEVEGAVYSGTSTYYYLNLREGSSDVAGTEVMVSYNNPNYARAHVTMRVRGTPGITRTLKLGNRRSGANACSLQYGGAEGGAGFGPLVMRVKRA